jgi:ABC-type transporter Mla subunit MlaD
MPDGQQPKGPTTSPPKDFAPNPSGSGVVTPTRSNGRLISQGQRQTVEELKAQHRRLTAEDPIRRRPIEPTRGPDHTADGKPPPAAQFKATTPTQDRNNTEIIKSLDKLEQLGQGPTAGAVYSVEHDRAMDDLRAELDESQAERKELAEQLRQAGNELAETRNELAETRNELAETRNELAETRQRNKNQEGTIKAQEADLETAQRDRRRLRETNDQQAEALATERKLHQGDHEILAIVTGDGMAHMWGKAQAQNWKERFEEERRALEGEISRLSRIATADAGRAAEWHREAAAAKSRARGAAQALIAEIGADGSENVEKTAERAAAEIRGLRAGRDTLRDQVEQLQAQADTDKRVIAEINREVHALQAILGTAERDPETGYPVVWVGVPPHAGCNVGGVFATREAFHEYSDLTPNGRSSYRFILRPTGWVAAANARDNAEDPPAETCSCGEPKVDGICPHDLGAAKRKAEEHKAFSVSVDGGPWEDMTAAQFAKVKAKVKAKLERHEIREYRVTDSPPPEPKPPKGCEHPVGFLRVMDQGVGIQCKCGHIVEHRDMPPKQHKADNVAQARKMILAGSHAAALGWLADEVERLGDRLESFESLEHWFRKLDSHTAAERLKITDRLAALEAEHPHNVAAAPAPDLEALVKLAEQLDDDLAEERERWLHTHQATFPDHPVTPKQAAEFDGAGVVSIDPTEEPAVIKIDCPAGCSHAVEISSPSAATPESVVQAIQLQADMPARINERGNVVWTEHTPHPGIVVKLEADKEAYEAALAEGPPVDPGVDKSKPS